MQMHVDKSATACNDFALSRYGSALNDVVFLGNVVVNGTTAKFTHFHVKESAVSLVSNGCWYCQATIRKYFLQKFIPEIEKAIAKHLKANNYRNSNFTVQFEVSDSSKYLFTDLGYTTKDIIVHGYHWNNIAIQFNLMSKVVKC